MGGMERVSTTGSHRVSLGCTEAINARLNLFTDTSPQNSWFMLRMVLVIPFEGFPETSEKPGK